MCKPRSEYAPESFNHYANGLPSFWVAVSVSSGTGATRPLLRLVDIKTTSTSVVVLAYEPAGTEGER
jgi:hypothetical protein